MPVASSYSRTGTDLATFTNWYEDLAQLDQVDWNLVGARYWADQPDDNDRQRRKQAEFLVWQSLDWSLIQGIGVLNAASESANVEALLGQHPDRPRPKVEVSRTMVLLVKRGRPMIEIAKGNILEADAEALVNTVNCIGFMGKGIALQFKQAYPANFKAYESACHAGQVVPGRMFIFDNGRLINPRYVINFPTKRHWRGKSRIGDIRSGPEGPH
jgi:hypothetical protein